MNVTLKGTAVRRGGRLQEWLLRYAPAEVLALIGLARRPLSHTLRNLPLEFGPAAMLTVEPMPEQATPELPIAQAHTAETETAKAETADDSTPEPPTAPMAAVGWASAEEIRPTPVVGWFPAEAATAELRIGSPR